MIGVGGFEFSKKAKQYISQILESNRITYGPFMMKFEEEFGKLVKAKYTAFTNSGTSALQIAIHALKIKYGWTDGEILCPSVTFVASVNTIIQNGMTPVLVDIDNYFMIDVSKIEKKITKNTKAIMVVHLLGQQADMRPIKRIARKHNLKIIEDSCESILAPVRGDIACYSTYTAHTLTTGVGGLACTNDKELATLMRSLMNHGRDGVYISIDDKPLQLSKRFSFIHSGYSYRLTEFEGALGLAQLDSLKRQIAKRIHNASYLTKYLKKLSLIQIPQARKSSYMMYPILSRQRDRLVKYLESKGIETRPLLPLTNQPIYHFEGSYPRAEYVNKYGFYIGCHPYITKRELDYIVKVFYTYESLYSRN